VVRYDVTVFDWGALLKTAWFGGLRVKQRQWHVKVAMDIGATSIYVGTQHNGTTLLTFFCVASRLEC
jgi:hypothetical protein